MESREGRGSSGHGAPAAANPKVWHLPGFGESHLALGRGGAAALASLLPVPEVQESAGSSEALGEIQEGNVERREREEDEI